MNITSETPRANATIQGHIFSVPAPFSEGYAVNANEAAALNQLLIENVRNNFASKVKAAIDTAGVEEGFLSKNEKGEIVGNLSEEQRATLQGKIDWPALQSELDTYTSDYEFGIRRGAAPILDPIEREMRDIALEHVTKALKKKNVKLKDFPKEEFERLVTDVLTTHGEVLRKKAEQIIKTRNSVAIEEIQINVA